LVSRSSLSRAVSVRSFCEHAFVLSRNQKGAAAEMAIAAAAVKLGVPVLKPLTEHGRYDLVFELGHRLFRVQCKWGNLDRGQGVVVVKVGCSWYSPNGYVRTTYGEDEIDLLAVYCGELDRCYLLSANRIAGKGGIHIRLTPPRNAQRASINLASEFEFAGAVAQLERASGWQPEGQGFESPQLHTGHDEDAHTVGAHQFRNLFGYYLELAENGTEIVVTRRGKPAALLGPVNGSNQQALDLAA
jgi:prevent-host-death family protein